MIASADADRSRSRGLSAPLKLRPNDGRDRDRASPSHLSLSIDPCLARNMTCTPTPLRFAWFSCCCCCCAFNFPSAPLDGVDATDGTPMAASAFEEYRPFFDRRWSPACCLSTRPRQGHSTPTPGTAWWPPPTPPPTPPPEVKPRTLSRPSRIAPEAATPLCLWYPALPKLASEEAATSSALRKGERPRGWTLPRDKQKPAATPSHPTRRRSLRMGCDAMPGRGDETQPMLSQAGLNGVMGGLYIIQQYSFPPLNCYKNGLLPISGIAGGPEPRRTTLMRKHSMAFQKSSAPIKVK